MRRREFIGVLGGTAALWPLVGIAQQRKTPTIGVLVVGSPGSEQFWQLFQKAMRDLGYVEGQSVRRHGSVCRSPSCWAATRRAMTSA